MTALDRYLAREILLPFLAGLVFLTQVLLATQILSQADVLFGSGVSAADVLRVVANMVPHLLGYVIPVAFLLGGVVGVGRLAEDRELVALSAAGISPVRLARTPLLLGLVVTAVALWVGLELEPFGLRSARIELNEIIKKNVSSDVHAGVFYEDIPDWTVYAGEVKGGHWRRVLISDRSDPSAPLLALAERGRLDPAEAGQAMRLVLENGELHRLPPGSDEYTLAAFRRAEFTIGLGNSISDRNRLVGSAFELQPAEIRELARGLAAKDPYQARRWSTFLYRRIAGPMAVLVFALLAVPIGASRRGGRAFGYGATLLTVVSYYALLRFGEGLAQQGVLPVWLGPNVANLAAAAAGLALLALMVRRGAGAVR